MTNKVSELDLRDYIYVWNLAGDDENTWKLFLQDPEVPAENKAYLAVFAEAFRKEIGRRRPVWNCLNCQRSVETIMRTADINDTESFSQQEESVLRYMEMILIDHESNHT